MSKIFLSYGRGDDQLLFVRDLCARMTRAGFDVWLDMERMPSRGVPFLQEVLDIIRACDRMVVVLGPAALMSAYVQAEWQTALVEGKVVTPILRLGVKEAAPPELARTHILDARAPRSVDESFAELVRVLADPILPLGELLGQVPELPSHFLPRVAAFSALARTVLEEVERPVVVKGPQRVTVVHGMPGVGKSVLAAAFARSILARRTFGGGILWVSAGPQTTPGELVQALLRVGNVPSRSDGNVDDGSVTALRTWLAPRRCLIVIDNAWQPEQVDPIASALSTASWLLVTTRDAGLTVGRGAAGVPVELLAPVEALAHLAAWVGGDAGTLPPEARDVAAECGYLPFALSLQGAMVKGGARWSDLLLALQNAELDFAEQKLPGYPHRTVLAAIQVSVEQLRATHPDAATRFLELVAFVWRDGVPEDVATAYGTRVPVAAHLGRKQLGILHEKALIRLEGGAGSRRVWLHDLVVDYLVARGDRVTANRALVERYRTASASDWPAGPDDGYFLEHLLTHLAMLHDHGAELRRLLLLENDGGQLAWFERVDNAGCVDPYHAFLRARAIDDGTGDADAARYLLMLVSSAARSANLPVALLDSLVASGAWTAARALDYARRLPESVQRDFQREHGVRLRALLAVSRHLPERERAAVVEDAWRAHAGSACGEEQRGAGDEASGLEELAGALAEQGRSDAALAVARRCGHADRRTTAYARVAAQLAGDARGAVIDEALEHVTTQWWFFWPAALEPLLPLLDSDGVRRVHTMVMESITNPTGRAWSIEPLVERLGELDAGAALRMAGTIGDKVSRAQALSAIAGKLPGDPRAAAVAEVLVALHAIDEDRWRDSVKEAGADLPESMQAVISTIFGGQQWRPGVITAIAAHLGDVQLAGLVALARETTDVRSTAAMLASLASVLPAAIRDELTGLVEARVASLVDACQLAQAVALAAPVLEGSRRTAIVEATLAAIDVAGDAAVVEAEATGKELAHHQRHFVEALSDVGPALTAETVPRFFQLVRRINDAQGRMKVIEAALPVLTPAQLVEARRATEVVGDIDEVALAAAALARGAGIERQREVLDRVAGCREYVRARALALLLPHVEDVLVTAVEAMIESIDDAETLGTVVLPALARRVDGARRTALLRRAIALATSLTDAERRVWTFEEFRNQLTPPLVEEAIAAFAATTDRIESGWRVYGQARFLVAVMEVVEPGRRRGLRGEVLALVPQLDDASLRRAILAMVPADDDRFEEIAQLGLGEPDPYERAITIGRLVGNAPPRWRDQLAAHVLADLPAIDAEGPRMEAAIARVMAYTEDPGYALGLVGRMRERGWQREALREFIRAGHPELRAMVKRAITLLADANDRATLYTELAATNPPTDRPAILAHALTSAMRGSSELLHDDVRRPLAAALIQLPAGDVRSMLRTERGRMSESDRPELLRKLHALAPALLHAYDDTAPFVDAILDAQRWWP